MPLVFKTPKDSPNAVELVGVGLLPGGGVGGLPVAVAAQRGLAPLVEYDPETGDVLTDEDGAYVVLEGNALTAAAKRFAAERGLEVVNLRDDAIAELPYEAGAPRDEVPDARTKAEQEAARISGSEYVLNDDPDASALGLPDPAANPETASTVKEG